MSQAQQLERRQDFRMASKVQCGVSLQFIAGADEAKRYLTNCGAASDVIARVLAPASARRSCETYDKTD